MLNGLEGLDRSGLSARTAPLLLLGEQFERAHETELKQVVVDRQAARVVTALDVRTVATVVGDDVHAIRVLADSARQGRQFERRFEVQPFDGHALQQRDHLRLDLLVLGIRVAELDVRTVATRLDVDRLSRLGVLADRLVALGLVGDQLQRVLDRQLVRARLVRDRRGLLVALHVRAITADACDDLEAVLVGAERDRVDLARVDLFLLIGQDRLETRRAVAVIEALQVRQALLVTARDGVELLLHLRREVGVDQRGEVALHQRHDREGGEGRHERRALLEHVVPPLDRVDDRGVRAGSTDARFLEQLDQRRLRQTRGRRRVVLVGGQLVERDVLALLDVRQERLALGQRRVRVVRTLDVGTQVTGEVDDAAVGLEHDVVLHTIGRGRLARDAQHHAAPFGVRHLARHRALPDELVDLGFVVTERGTDLLDRRHGVAGGTDGLVRLLRVLDLPFVAPRFRREILVAVVGLDQLTRLLDGMRAEHNRVRSHVGDVTVLVQLLGGAHRAARVEAQLAVAFLLERRGDERRRGRAREGLLFGGQDRESLAAQRLAQRVRAGVVQEVHVVALEFARIRVEVLAAGDAFAVDRDQLRVERLLVVRTELGREVPVLA